MALEPIQKPNTGTPDFATRRRGRKVAAIVTTVAFAVFWVMLLYVAAEFFAGRGVDLPLLVMCAAGLGLGLWGRRQVERD